MIDINELRRLAQAATPGPWYATGKLTRYVEARIDGGLIQEVAACGPTKADGGYGPQQEANARLIAAANPATISELFERLEAAEKERDTLRAKIEAMERLEPVAWRTFDGEGGYDYRSYEDNENYKLGWDARNPNYIGWVEPLYALPGAQGE